jgi:hypothetical protein
MSRFNRTNFYPKVVIENSDGIDVNINEFGNSYYDQFFEIKRELTLYTIKQEDIQRPDLISFKIYGTDQYWWILMKYNQIADIWNEIVEGNIIYAPNVLDITDFVISATKAAQK